MGEQVYALNKERISRGEEIDSKNWSRNQTAVRYTPNIYVEIPISLPKSLQSHSAKEIYANLPIFSLSEKAPFSRNFLAESLIGSESSNTHNELRS